MNFESFSTLRYRNICAKLKFKWQLENERIFLVATFFLNFRDFLVSKMMLKFGNRLQVSCNY